MAESQTQSFKKTKWYNRRLIVEGQFQYKLIFYAFIMSLLLISLGSIFTLIIQRSLVLAKAGWFYFGPVDWMLIGTLAAVLVFGTYIFLIFSNHMAGPVRRIIREMEKMRDGGTLQKIEFRQADYFKDLARAYNDVIDQLNAINEKNKR